MELAMDRGFTFDQLPDDCFFNILSLTSPADWCRSAVVSRNFQRVADSDRVWGWFLPSDIGQILSSAGPVPLPAPNKKLFLHLSDNPLLIDNGSKSFSLEKCSGKKCYMIAASNLTIIWGDTPAYWLWRTDPESRFPEVAELLRVCWLEIRGRMEARLLSPNTSYGAYLVFRLTDRSYGLGSLADVSVNLAGEEGERKTVCLNPEHPSLEQEQIPKEREDGWVEIEMGEFFNESGEDRLVEMNFWRVRGGHWKSGLIVQGIELRPKNNH